MGYCGRGLGVPFLVLMVDFFYLDMVFLRLQYTPGKKSIWTGLNVLYVLRLMIFELVLRGAWPTRSRYQRRDPSLGTYKGLMMTTYKVSYYLLVSKDDGKGRCLQLFYPKQDKKNHRYCGHNHYGAPIDLCFQTHRWSMHNIQWVQ